LADGSVEEGDMSADDYLARLRKRQPKIFAAKTIQIEVASLEEQIRAAFNVGHSAGAPQRSLFDSLFGPGPGKR
jgi:hypothetical protein